MKKGIFIILVSFLTPLTTHAQSVDNAFTEVLTKHLDAVSNRDLPTLKSTMSPDGLMILILPQSEMLHTTDAFIEYHRNWFESTSWSLESEIAMTEIGEDMGMAIVNSTYREPERDGKPYYNEMIISYTLKLVDNQWYVIKDHMCSIKKSTD